MRTHTPILLGCVLGLVTAVTETTADEVATTIPVGVARVDITPTDPIRLSGYGSRKTESEGVAQQLWAKALAFGDEQVGEGAAVLVAVDNCGVPDKVTEEVARRLKARIGLPRERFALCSSHTHTGPCLAGNLSFLFPEPVSTAELDRIEQYTRRLTDAIESVCLDALKDRRPGRLAWGQGEVGFAANRRVLKEGKWTGFGVNPEGPVDHSLPMLRATDADGSLRAVVVGYACHCTTLGGDFNQICGDWAGYAQEAIERDHPGVTALVVIGCGADANPEPRLKLEMARDHGETVAREVARLLKGSLRPLPATLGARFQRVELPFAPLPAREEWERKAQEPGSVGLHSRAMLERLDRGEALPTTLTYPVQTWSFGDELAVVFLGGEVVVDYALRLKRERDGSRLWVVAYANDVPSYIASRRILREGGYEADFSMVYYGQPTRFAPEVEDLIIRTVRDLLPESFAAGGH